MCSVYISSLQIFQYENRHYQQNQRYQSGHCNQNGDIPRVVPVIVALTAPLVIRHTAASLTIITIQNPVDTSDVIEAHGMHCIVQLTLPFLKLMLLHMYVIDGLTSSVTQFPALLYVVKWGQLWLNYWVNPWINYLAE